MASAAALLPFAPILLRLVGLRRYAFYGAVWSLSVVLALSAIALSVYAWLKTPTSRDDDEEPAPGILDRKAGDDRLAFVAAVVALIALLIMSNPVQSINTVMDGVRGAWRSP